MSASEKLAILGGEPAVKAGTHIDPWPFFTEEDEQAVLDVLRGRKMSGTDITEEFEQEFAQWEGTDYCLACNNGTSALHCAFYGAGIRRGDEVISSTWTFWATHTQLLSLGASVVFCDIDPKTLCPDPDDIARHITPKTKAIIAVHLFGYPAEMDAIMDLANEHGLVVIEDYSHSQGSTYKGQKVGSIAHVGGASIMSSKPLATGEGGVLTTNDRDIYEKAICFGHYERMGKCVQNPEYRRFIGPPWGGYKYRMHQMTSAVARVQLKYYDERRALGVKCVERFYGHLSEIEFAKPNWPFDDPDKTVNASYCQRLILDEDVVRKVPVERICEAIKAEGSSTGPGVYYCHHLHPVWNELDVFGDGKPTRIAFSERDIRQGPGSLPVAESIAGRIISVPRFAAYQPEVVDQHAEAFRKVLTNLDKL